MNPKPPISDEEVRRRLEMLTAGMNAPPHRVAHYSFCPGPVNLTLGSPGVTLDGQETLSLPIDAFIRVSKTVEVDEDEPCEAVLEDGTRILSVETPFLELHQTVSHEIVVRGRYSGWVPDGAHRAGETFAFAVTLLGVGHVPLGVGHVP